MSDTSRTAERLRDEAVAASIAATEHRREAERLRAMYEDVRDQLVEVSAAYDELRREHEQVQGSERAVRRLVLRAAIDGEVFVSIADARHALDTGEAP